MAVEIVGNGSIVTVVSVHENVAVTDRHYEIETVSGILEGGYPLYAGPYNIAPLTKDDIILPTSNRSTIEDITVQKIPYYETSNPSGGYTAIIG